MAIVSQVLGNKVAHHFKEFATMKALGYPQRYISGTVIMQATAIAVMGYLPGLLVASVGYDFTTRLAHIPMRLGVSEAATVFVLAVGMCVAAASTALRKVARAAPADLF
jgi:putative ABC transport system permease protein